MYNLTEINTTEKRRTGVNSKKRADKGRRRDRRFIFAMLLWPALHLILFSVVINVSTIVMSFMRYDGQQARYVGGYNYKGIFEGFFDTGTISKVFVNSLTVFPVNLLVIVLAMLFSYFLFRRIAMYKTFRVLFFLPSIISVVVLIMAYRYMFDENFGPITLMLRSLGMGGAVPHLGWFGTRWSSWRMLWMYLVWSGIGYNIVLIQGAMTRIPAELLESARIDGAGMAAELFKIIIPLIMQTVSTMIFFSMMGIFTMFVQPQLMFGMSNADRFTVALYIVNQTKMGGLNGQAGAAALGVCITIIGGPIMIALRAAVNKLTPDIEY